MLECAGMQPIEFVLASSSPRRREMLAWLGFHFRLQPAGIDENQLSGEDPISYVRRLAREKAARAARLAGKSIVLAADTIVELDGVVLGKPEDAEDARKMLTSLRGRYHNVVTALHVIGAAGRQMPDLCISRVSMRNYSDEEMEAYIRSGDPLDKAGAYAIQNAGFNPAQDFQGCMASVMGLPMCHLARVLAKLGVEMLVKPVNVCRENLRYDCPIHARVLAGEELG